MMYVVNCLIYSIIDYVFVFKQKTAYEMRISDWSSDVCSSDLLTSDHKSNGLILATLIFAAQSAHAQSLPVEHVGERPASAVEKVEIEESAVVDGTADA